MTSTVDFAVPSDPEDVPGDLSSARLLHHRLNSALDDLGLAEALPPRWVTPARSGFFFAPHNLNQAARLVDALERLSGVLSETGIDVHDLRTADLSADDDPFSGPDGIPITG